MRGHGLASLLGLTPWLAIAGAGIGLVTAPVTTAALGSDESAGYGATAAVFNTFRTTGLTLGVAIMGAILASFGPVATFARDFDRQHHAAFVDGFSVANFWATRFSCSPGTPVMRSTSSGVYFATSLRTSSIP